MQIRSNFFWLPQSAHSFRALCVCENCVMQDTDSSPAVGLRYHTVRWGTGHLHPHMSLDQAWFNPGLIFGVPRDKSWWIKCCHHCIWRWAPRVLRSIHGGESCGWCVLWKSGCVTLRRCTGADPQTCLALVSEAEMTLQLVCAWQLLSSKTIVLYPITS